MRPDLDAQSAQKLSSPATAFTRQGGAVAAIPARSQSTSPTRRPHWFGGLITRLTGAGGISWLGHPRDSRRALIHLLRGRLREAEFVALLSGAAQEPVSINGMAAPGEIMLWLNGPPESPFILQLGLARDRSALRVVALEQATPALALDLIDRVADLSRRLSPMTLEVMSDPQSAVDALLLARAGFIPLPAEWPALVTRLAHNLCELAPDPTDPGRQAVTAALAFSDPRALWLIADRQDPLADGSPLGPALVRPLSASFTIDLSDPAAAVRRAACTGDWPVSLTGDSLAQETAA